MITMKRRGLAYSAALGLAGVTAVGLMSGVCRAGEDAAPAAGCPSGACVAKAPAAHAVINTAGLAALLRAKTPVVILDARTGKYDDGKRLPGARSVATEWTEAEAKTAVPDKNALVVTYCGSVKCPASGLLAENLRKWGYTNVLKYPEGVAGWIEGGNTVEETKK